MAPTVSNKLANELYKAFDRLEYATELIKLWVQYMDGHLTPAEEELIKKCKEFLGENK